MRFIFYIKWKILIIAYNGDRGINAELKLDGPQRAMISTKEESGTNFEILNGGCPW